MLDIQVKFYEKTRKNVSLYYSTNNAVLFPNRIKTKIFKVYRKNYCEFITLCKI